MKRVRLLQTTWVTNVTETRGGWERDEAETDDSQTGDKT
jgi:hypothetical protein